MGHLSQPPQRLRNHHGKRQGRRKSKGWEGKEGMEKYKSKRQGEMRKCCHLDATWSLHSGTKGRFRSGGEQASNAIQHPNRQQSLDSGGDIAKQRQKKKQTNKTRGNERQSGTY